MQRVPDGNQAAGEASRSPASFERDVLALVPALRRYSRSLAGSRADGEDLLQDCVERILVRRHQWRGGSLKAWAFTIMTNLNRNRFRDPARQRMEALDPHVATLADSAAVDAEEKARLARAFGRLSADHRAVLILVAVEGYSYEEVAGILQVPIGTVMSRLSRARQALTEAMDADNVIALRRPK